MPPSIFFDFNLPNATTWFYFSVTLAGALYFKFTRFFSLRNWDVLALFVMVPGLLLVQEGQERRREARRMTEAASRLACWKDPAGAMTLVAGAVGDAARPRAARATQLLSWGYIVLLGGSGYWALRCMFDLWIPRRPLLAPNMNLSGLAWFAAALFVSLGVVAVEKPAIEDLELGPPNPVVLEAQARATDLVGKTTGQYDRETIRWWVERTLSGSCHLSILIALVLVGARHYGDTALGMAAATAYLLLPYIAFHLTQVHHVLPTAFLLWAVVGYRRPRLAGAMIGIAAGGFGFPALVAPVWASFYRGRGFGRFLAAFAIAAGASLAVAALVLWLNGRFDLRIPTTMGLPEWRKWRMPDAEGFWTGVHWAYRIPLFLASVAFVVVTFFWPTPKDLGHVIALSSVHLLIAQLWYAQRGGVYVLWYLPLLLLLVFRPNLTDLLPPEPVEIEKVKS